MGFESQLRAYAQANYDVYAARQLLIRYRLRALRQYRVLDCGAIGEFASSSGIDSSSQGKIMDTLVMSTEIRNRTSVGDANNRTESGHKRSWDDRKSCDNNVEDDYFIDGGEDEKNSLYRFENEDNRAEDNGEGVTKRNNRERGNLGGDTDMLRVSTPMTVVAPVDIKSKGGNRRSSTTESSAQIITKIPTIDARTPHCRLSRPSRQSVRVIPPLRGLDNGFCCSWCGFGLFYLANVIRVDGETIRLVGQTARAEDKCCGDYYYSSSDCSDAIMEHESSHSSNSSSGFRSSSNNLSLLSPKIPSPSKTKMSISTSGSISISTSMGPPTPRTPTTPLGAKSGFDRADKESFGVSYSYSSSSVDTDCKMAHIDADNSVAAPKTPSPPKTSRGAASKSFDFNDFNDQPASLNGTNSSSSDVKSADNDFSHPMSPLSSSSHYITVTSATSPVVTGTKGHVIVPSIRIGGFENKFTPSSIGALSEIASTHLKRNNSIDSTGGSNARSSVSVDDSPRIVIPPHRSIGTLGDWSTAFDRPQSVERRRWLDRVSLLQDSVLERDMTASRDARVTKLAEEDDDASLLAIGKGKHIHLEYMTWMGSDILRKHVDAGDIRCPNPTCQKTIGSYNWNPGSQQSLQGALDAPIIRVHKSVVHLGTFLLDVTPNATPRPE